MGVLVSYVLMRAHCAKNFLRRPRTATATLGPGQNLAKHYQTWFGLLFCPGLSSTQKPVHLLPVLESEQNCVVWARYVRTVSLWPHIHGGVLQCAGPAYSSGVRTIPGYYVPGCAILLYEIPKMGILGHAIC